MAWTEPPLPPSGIPGVRRGQVLAPGHPVWQRWHDERVWGTMAGFGRHNPFFGDHDPEADPAWQENRTHHNLSAWRVNNPEAYQRAHQGMVAGLKGNRTAIAISTPALHKVLDSGRVKSGFETGHNFRGELDPVHSGYLHARREQEALHFGYPHDHPVEGRPVYGYLTNDVFRDSSAKSYGGHTLVVSPSVNHRTTWSAADTLDVQKDLRPSPRNAPHLRSIPHYLTDGRRRDWGLKDFLGDHEWRGGDYMEAQIHGGVPLHHVHYAILRSPTVVGSTGQENIALSRRLSEHGVPWVHMVGGWHSPDDSVAEQPLDWDNERKRHLGALMSTHAKITEGAFVAGHDPLVHWHQGSDRFIVELAEPGHSGLPMGQVADLEWGTLHPPVPVESILSRGYWERLAHPVEVEDILAKVRPVG